MYDKLLNSPLKNNNQEIRIMNNTYKYQTSRKERQELFIKVFYLFCILILLFTFVQLNLFTHFGKSISIDQQLQDGIDSNLSMQNENTKENKKVKMDPKKDLPTEETETDKSNKSTDEAGSARNHDSQENSDHDSKQSSAEDTFHSFHESDYEGSERNSTDITNHYQNESKNIFIPPDESQNSHHSHKFSPEENIWKADGEHSKVGLDGAKGKGAKQEEHGVQPGDDEEKPNTQPVHEEQGAKENKNEEETQPDTQPHQNRQSEDSPSSSDAHHSSSESHQDHSARTDSQEEKEAGKENSNSDSLPASDGQKQPSASPSPSNHSGHAAPSPKRRHSDISDNDTSRDSLEVMNCYRSVQGVHLDEHFSTENFIKGFTTGLELAGLHANLSAFLKSMQYKFPCNIQGDLIASLHSEDSDKLHISINELSSIYQNILSGVNEVTEEEKQFVKITNLLTKVVNLMTKSPVLIDLQRKSITINNREVYEKLENIMNVQEKRDWQLDGEALGRFAVHLTKNDFDDMPEFQLQDTKKVENTIQIPEFNYQEYNFI